MPDKMTDSPLTPLTDKTLTRLRSLAKGGGLDPSVIELIETKEKVFAIKGTLTLQAQSETESQQSFGRIKQTPTLRVFASLSELASEVQTLQKSFIQDGRWIDKALEELDKTKGHGWGLEAALLSWSTQKIQLAASESCPTCHGTAQHPCNDCKGIGYLHCYTCEGRGRELCPLCYGHKMDPANPEKKCWQCEGTGYAICRFCHGQGKTVCPTCKGRGSMPCTECNGTGFISQSVTVTQGARLDFTLTSTSSLPSGLLRLMSRIGNDKLAEGHADVALSYTPPEKQKPTDTAQIDLTASLPYADIKIRFAGKGALVNVFGKKGILAGVPPFLDKAVAGARQKLAEAAQGNQALQDALGPTRLMREAFDLVLSGKTHPNHLRRLYPVGLSGEAAKDIMALLMLALKKETAATRLYAAVGCTLGATLVFALLFFVPPMRALLDGLGPAESIATQLVILSATLGLVWAALTYATKWNLKRLYPAAAVATGQNIGKTGLSALGVITVIYLLMAALS